MLEDLKIGSDYEGFAFLAESVRNPPALRAHHHAELELNLVVAGEVTYVMGGKRYRFPKRSLLWFFPSQEHQLVDRSRDAAYYVAVFKPDLIRRTCRGHRYRELRRKRPTVEGLAHSDLSLSDFESLKTGLEAAVQDGIDPDLLNREAGFGLSEGFRFRHNDPDWLNAALRHLLLRAWRMHCGLDAGRRAVVLHPAVGRALDLIEAGKEEPATLSTLAESCGVSGSFLSRRFHKEVGVTLAHYRNSVRLGRFWEVRRANPSISFLDAALAAGFGSYAQFYRVYKSAYGESPRGASAVRTALDREAFSLTTTNCP